MERIQMNLKRLSLTDIVIDINRVPKKKVLIEAMDKAGECCCSILSIISLVLLPCWVGLGHQLSCKNLFADVKNKWEKSSWGRKLIVQKRRAALNDFDRFKVMLAKIKVGIHIFFGFSSVFRLHLYKILEFVQIQVCSLY